MAKPCILAPNSHLFYPYLNLAGEAPRGDGLPAPRPAKRSWVAAGLADDEDEVCHVVVKVSKRLSADSCHHLQQEMRFFLYKKRNIPVPPPPPISLPVVVLRAVTCEP